MPKLQKIFTLEVTPEQFLESCSATELMELQLLLQSPRYQMKVAEPYPTLTEMDEED